MKFGKLDSVDELGGVQLDLPNFSNEISDNIKRAILVQSSKPTITTGGTMWTIKPWRGIVYPMKEPMKTWPEYYGKQFSSIEFNATHYRIYPPEKMREWAEKMPEGFLFCPKFPAIISHYRRFNNCEGPTDDFIEGVLAMGDKLGPAFLQLSPHFKPSHSEKLIAYLHTLPRDLKVAVEFRHPEWFEGGVVAERVWATLSELGIGAVISDTAGRRDAVHMRLTSPFLIVRFGGYDGHITDNKRMKNWVEKISELQGHGVTELHFLIHQTNSIHTPHTCVQFADLIYDSLKIKVKHPKLLL